MSYTVRFLPEVEGDVMTAYEWYEGKAVGLGVEFLRVFYAHVAGLRRTPLIFPKVHRDFHRSLLRRFPYACYYRIMDDSVIVYGAFHCARNPSSVNKSIGVRHER